VAHRTDTSVKNRFAYVNSDYKVRLEPAKILEQVKELQP